jgi:hypothetical protein
MKRMTGNAVAAGPVTGRSVTELESALALMVTDASSRGSAMVPVIAELYRRRAWESRKSQVGPYFRDFLGIGGDDGFALARGARRSLVRLLDDAEVVHLTYMTGRSKRIIERDRSDMGLVNENRAAASRKSMARKYQGRPARPVLVPPAVTYEWLSSLADEELLAIDADLHRVLRDRGKEGKA